MDEVVTESTNTLKTLFLKAITPSTEAWLGDAETVPPEVRLAFENQLFDKTYSVDNQGNLSTSKRW